MDDLCGICFLGIDVRVHRSLAEIGGRNVKLIELMWSGPLPASSLADTALSLKGIDEAGVYVWCVGGGGHFYVTYVGKADCLRVRLRQHVGEARRGGASLFRHVGGGALDDVEIGFIPGYDIWSGTEDQLQMVEANLKKQFVFFASLVRYEGEVRSVDVEGAIQAALFRRRITRQYLVTGVSSYALRGYRIESIFDHGEVVHGLDQPIETP